MSMDATSSAPSARRQATRTRLMEAAAEVFAEAGLQAASVEAVCTRAGFTRGAFYSNFASKEELFLTLLGAEFDQRTTELRTHAAALEQRFRERDHPIDPPEAARLIVEFFMPPENALEWTLLETEFQLLAMRDPQLAPGYLEYVGGFIAGISDVIEPTLAAAGRRFRLPVAHAVPALVGVYERAVRASALGGSGAPEGLGELGDRLAEMLFALTEELGSSGGDAIRRSGAAA